jgi:formimidoylglutamate deiminase
MRTLAIHADAALLPRGWARDVRITIDAGGAIAEVLADAPTGDAEPVAGALIPGLANLHSHAFQRAMAGLTEARTAATDSFWTWRELMYRFAARITPEQLEAIASHLYIEMLKAGYTAVAEFHYLHHAADGARYDDRAEMSERIVAAAAHAGIALTHLPVLYAYGGFGGKAASAGQARFLHGVEEYLAMTEALRSRHRGLAVGTCFHSLRAVDAAMIEAVMAASPRGPVHIHIAEQRQEVEECLAWSGQRPVAWLLDHAKVDSRWCLVHATHLDDGERRALAASGAVAGLCPTTEANLGDGLFPAEAYVAEGGTFGVGSDSHVEVDARAELRLLEYGQRLRHHRRAVLPPDLYARAATGGAQALAREAGQIAVGKRADLVALDRARLPLANVPDAQLLDAWIFASGPANVRDVMVDGVWQVRDGRHPREEECARRFAAAQAALLA